MPRSLSLSLEAKSGQIHEFSATVGATLVVDADGSKKRTYSGEVPDSPTTVRIWVTGVPGATYEVAVDLPGKVNDFVWKYTLAATLQSVQFDV